MKNAVLTTLALGLAACSPAPAPQPEPVKTTVTLEIINPQGVKFAAYQDGNGAWKPLEGGAKRTFDVVDRFGVVVVCPIFDTNTYVYVNYSTVAELTDKTLERYCYLPSSRDARSHRVSDSVPPSYHHLAEKGPIFPSSTGVLTPQATPYSVDLTLQGIPAGKRVDYHLGSSSGTAESGIEPLKVNRSINSNPTDIFVFYRDGKSFFSPLVKLMGLRDYVVTENRSETFDFASSSGTPLVKRTLTTAGSFDPTGITGQNYYRNSRGTFFFMEDITGSPPSTNTLPADLARPGDRYDMYLYSKNSSASQELSIGYSWNSSVDPLPTFTFPIPFDSPTAQVADTTGYVRLKTLWTAFPGVKQYYIDQYRFISNSRKGAGTLMSAGYAKEISSYTLPNWSALAGWNNEWLTQKGEEIKWIIYAEDFEGNFNRGSSKSGSLTP